MGIFHQYSEGLCMSRWTFSHMSPLLQMGSIAATTIGPGSFTPGQSEAQGLHRKRWRVPNTLPLQTATRVKNTKPACPVHFNHQLLPQLKLSWFSLLSWCNAISSSCLPSQLIWPSPGLVTENKQTSIATASMDIEALCGSISVATLNIECKCCSRLFFSLAFDQPMPFP